MNEHTPSHIHRITVQRSANLAARLSDDLKSHGYDVPVGFGIDVDGRERILSGVVSRHVAQEQKSISLNYVVSNEPPLDIFFDTSLAPVGEFYEALERARYVMLTWIPIDVKDLPPENWFRMCQEYEKKKQEEGAHHGDVQA